MDSYPSFLSSCQTYDCRKGAIITLSHSHVTHFMISTHAQVQMAGLGAGKPSSSDTRQNFTDSPVSCPRNGKAPVAPIITFVQKPRDTLFMADVMTARLPGKRCARAHHPTRKLLDLPDDTRIYICHDSKA